MARNNNDQRRRRGRRRFNRNSDKSGDKGAGQRESGQKREKGPRREINADLPREVKFRMPDPPPKREYGSCPICSQPMRDIQSAIAFPPGNEPAHFECVVRRIGEDEHISSGERVVYLGNGSFGIVEDQSAAGDSKYVIKRRIQFEEPDRSIAWRKELSPGISRD
ncbi:hypothetical protein [Salinispira pacifica]